MRDTPTPIPDLPAAEATLSTSADAAQAGTAATTEAKPAPSPARLDPTRYGDWELNGKCVDF
ncbi:MAG: DUF1674 domain-containing protein [Alphaproteobacteria bacterium]|nr:DUF1674 domain-containing protein [Alphaproteobacteria bacterium]